MRTMILSFRPDVYERIETGQKIFEYRRTFPHESIRAFTYVSKSVCAVTGVLTLGGRYYLQEWKEKFKEDEDAVNRLSPFMRSADTRACLKIMSF